MARNELRDAPESTVSESTWSSASKLSRKVRELANRSFHALKAGPQHVALTEARSNDILQDLRDLRDQIARLQRKIHERNLESLIPWGDALKQKVDDRLVHTGKAEE
jgi:hypothetical protein